MRNRAMRAFPFTLVPVSIYVQPPCTGVSTFVDRNEGGNGRVTYKDDGGTKSRATAQRLRRPRPDGGLRASPLGAGPRGEEVPAGRGPTLVPGRDAGAFAGRLAGPL